MNCRTSCHLLFFIKRKKLLKTGKASIFLKITINNKHTEFVLNCSVTPELWCKHKGGPKGNSKEAKQVIEFIDSVKFRIQSIINRLNQKEVKVEAKIIKSKYLWVEPKVKTVLEIFNDHNEKIKSLIGKGFSNGTYLRYKVTIKHIENFILFKYKLRDIEVTKVNHEFISDLEFYLKGEKGCGQNTTMKYLKNFKKIIRIAINNDWLVKDPYANFKLTWEKTNRDFLTEEEINLLIKKQFSIDRIQTVKDCFLFACYTGLSHSDLKLLTPKDIVVGIDKKSWISIKRKKTNIQSNIPLLPVAMSIIDKYKDHPEVERNQVLLPVLSNQKMNAYLKEIADICGITKTLTSHVARHTFATTITLNNDVPIESVSKMLGHSSLEMTKIYAKLLDKKVSRDMDAIALKYSS